jgi:WD40 repeat protein
LFEINNASNQSILALEGHTGNVTCLGFQRNGRYLYSSSEDGTVSYLIHTSYIYHIYLTSIISYISNIHSNI